MNSLILFKFFLGLLSTKKYTAAGGTNEYRLASGYFISVQWEEITIVNEYYNREDTRDLPQVLRINKDSEYITWEADRYLEVLLMTEIWGEIMRGLLDRDKVSSDAPVNHSEEDLSVNTKNVWKRFKSQKK